MSDKTRFRRRRALLKSRGLCQRCGEEPALPGLTIGKQCAAEIRTKKIVAPSRVYRCEKIARLERNLALFEEAAKTCREKIGRLKAG